MTVVFGVDGGPALPASGKSMISGIFISSLFANPVVPDLLGARVDDEATST